MAPERPRLRPVEAFPIEHEGRRFLALRDPSGLAERTLLVAAEAAGLLVRLDGRHTLDDLVSAHFRDTGVLLARHEVERFVEMLDREHFLDSPAAARRRALLTEAYRAAPHRPAAHAGISYPADPEHLASHLAALERATHADVAAPDGGGQLLAIVAPHIDLRVGAATYVPAYRALAAAGGADVAVVLGVGHMGIPGLFAAGTLDFATPLGVARTDRAFVAELQAAFGDDLTAEELVFRTDHTVEFQVLFLQHVLGDAVRIVPLLASFGFEEARGDAAGRIDRFVAALRDTIARRRDEGARVVVVVSADLAHVGPRYGDPAPFDEEQLRGVEEADRAVLETVAAGDAAALLDRIAADRDRFRICGFSPLYTALGAIGARGGRLLAYGRGPTDGAGSICSYASLALYDRAAGAPGLPITDGGETR